MIHLYFSVSCAEPIEIAEQYSYSKYMLHNTQCTNTCKYTLHYVLLNKWETVWKGTRRSISIILEAKLKYILELAEQPFYRIMC
jgi:hypothetical protein